MALLEGQWILIWLIKMSHIYTVSIYSAA